MGVEKHYVKFYLQELQKEPTGFPPPWDTTTVYGDGRTVMGFFLQKQSQDVLIAAAQGIMTQGRFVTNKESSLLPGDTLRREFDSVYIRLEGDPLTTPAYARTQAKTYDATITNRNNLERAALLPTGLSDLYETEDAL